MQSALSRLIKDKMVMVIAHRMRTVAGENNFVVLSDGGVAEQSSPDQLLKAVVSLPKWFICKRKDRAGLKHKSSTEHYTFFNWHTYINASRDRFDLRFSEALIFFLN